MKAISTAWSILSEDGICFCHWWAEKEFFSRFYFLHLWLWLNKFLNTFYCVKEIVCIEMTRMSAFRSWQFFFCDDFVLDQTRYLEKNSNTCSNNFFFPKAHPFTLLWKISSFKSLKMFVDILSRAKRTVFLLMLLKGYTECIFLDY